MRHRLPAALAALLILIAIPAVTAPALAGASARSEHDRIVAYWTPARMRAAIPRDFRFDPVRGLAPAARPGSGGAVLGASWPDGQGTIYQASGKVYFEMGGGAWVCSGSIATDSRTGYSLVLTAGHCAYDETGHAFATNWLFIPQFDSAPTFTCSQTAYGCWTARALVVHNGFASAGGFNTQATLYDFAFAVVGPGGKSNTQADAIGSFPIAFTSVAVNTVVDAFGYPAAQKYHGKDLIYCAGPVSYDPLNSNLTYRLPCDMTGGSSGGPWLSPFTESTGTGTLRSLNSYGYSGIKAMHGPKFNSNTQAVYNAANTATSNTIVP